MAIYHFHQKPIKRSEGRNAVQSAAYRHATRFFDETENMYFDFSRKKDVIFCEILVPKEAPEWAKSYSTEANNDNSLSPTDIHHLKYSSHETSHYDLTDAHVSSERLWNTIEKVEKRINAQLAIEMEFSLPIELTLEQNIHLAREFLKYYVVSQNKMVDWSVHWDKGNPHVHALITMREFTETGFGKKYDEWQDRKQILRTLRKGWADHANFYLHYFGHNVRIDHRSFVDQGIDLLPTFHRGKAVRDMEKRGIETERTRQAHELHNENLHRIIKTPVLLLEKMSKQKDIISDEDIAQSLSTYSNEHSTSLESASESALSSSHQFAQNFTAQVMAALANNMKVEEQEIAPDHILSQNEIDEILKNIEHHDSAFSDRDIVKILGQKIDNAELLTKALMEVKASDQLLRLGIGEDGRERYTTRGQFTIEMDIQRHVDMLRNHSHSKISAASCLNSIKKFERQTNKTLTLEQRDAVKYLTQNSSITCLVGRAGTGKSFTLGVANRVWSAKGFDVHGIALSGVAAEGLRKDAGIHSSTIHAFYDAIRGENPQITLHKKSVIVMDESGMTDSVAMLNVLNAVKQSGAKLVLAGDPEQLQPVGPGAVYRAILDRVGYCELNDVYRQRTSWQREATRDFAAGKIHDAIHAYDERGYVHLESNEERAMQKLVDTWGESTFELKERIVLAYENENIQLLNKKLRQKLIDAEKLAEGYQVFTRNGPISIAKNDRILFLKNNKTLGVRNGTFSSISHVEMAESGKVLWFEVVLDGEEHKRVKVDPTQYKDFTYGFAATVHKSQGITLDESYVYIGGKNWFRNLIYVAATRHRYKCHLYAAKTQYRDLKELKRILNKLQLKDSVLNYPKAFAERRGIALDKISVATLMQSLHDRLNTMKEKLTDRIEFYLHPEGFNQKVKQRLEEQRRIDEKYQRAEDATLVAKYMDIQSMVSKENHKISEYLTKLGFDRTLKQPEAFTVMQDMKEYQLRKKYVEERDEIASQIAKETSRYQIALDSYAIDVTVIKEQADRHHARELLTHYKAEKATGKNALIEKLAYELMQNIKLIYPLLKEENIEPSLLKEEAQLHQRYQLLSTLPKEALKSFEEVEEYRRLNKVIAEFKKTHANDTTLIYKNDEYIALCQDRNRLAYAIFSSREKYAHALDFYQIGKPHDTPHTVAQEQHLYAAKKWYNLQSFAAIYENALRVDNYITLLEENHSDRYALAHAIMQDTKAHHGAIVTKANDPKTIWNNIRADAKQYQRDSYYETLTHEQKVIFLKVEHYVKVKREYGKAWRDILDNKENQKLSTQQLFDTLSPNIKPLSRARERLADSILADLPEYLFALKYFNIDHNELNKPAYKEICYQRVNDYVACLSENISPFERSKIASEIIKDPKSHYSGIMDHQLFLKAITKDAKLFERKQLFSTLSSEEKKFIRLSDQLKASNKKLAIMLKDKNKQPHAFKKQREKIESVNSLRDKLASKWVEKYHYLHYISPNDPIGLIGQKSLKLEKMEKASQTYLQREAHIAAWESDYSSILSMVPHVNKAFLENQKDQLFDIGNYFEEKVSEMNNTFKELIKYPYRYRANLNSRGLEVDTFKNKITLLSHISKQITSLSAGEKVHIEPTLTPEIKARLKKAENILSETKPIAGTLAETYLRDMRKISTDLPTSYRYHPSVKCYELNKSLPALVVESRNADKQLRSVQLIYLDPQTANKALLPNGKSAKKITHGVPSLENAAVLVNEGKDREIIAVAEGPETALSIKEAYPHLTIYCTLGTSNFHRLPLSNTTKDIVFFSDNDGIHSGSQKVLAKAASKLRQKANVWQIMPEAIPGLTKTDFNDVLKNKGKEFILAAEKDMSLVAAANTEIKKYENLQESIHQLLDDKTVSNNVLKAPSLTRYKDVQTMSQKPIENTHPLVKLINELATLKQLPNENKIAIMLMEKKLKTEIKIMQKKPSELDKFVKTYPEYAQMIKALAQSASRKR